jgi:nitrite reductase/ring-hydroxylating ferredoxin subunit
MTMKFPLIPVAEIPAEGAKEVDFFGRSVLVYLVEGQPRAVANVCLHLGGPLQCQGDKFVCAWHGAEYAFADGHRLAGPVRPDAKLMRLPTRIEDGVLTYVYGE